MRAFELSLKRAMDVVVSAAILIITTPLLALAAACVRLSMGRPVLFRQERPGLNAIPFEILKFRTMTDEQNANGDLLPDEVRLTRLGVYLRVSSVDELPQFINVLRGEMSLVGPRPLLMRYLPRYSDRQATRHRVKPGITGWAQVNGRNALTWEEKLELDAWYVENCSLRLDVVILWRTVLRVMLSRGISNPGHATMPEFQNDGRGAIDSHR